MINLRYWYRFKERGYQGILTVDSVKILGCHHSYNTDLAFDRNFCDTISNISDVLNLWCLRGLSLLERDLIFKTLGFSKIQYLAAMSVVPTKVTDELKAIQNRFIWKHSTTKIKHFNFNS